MSFTEYEEDILFDHDDPDFQNNNVKGMAISAISSFARFIGRPKYHPAYGWFRRFWREDIARLKEALGVPDILEIRNRYTVSGTMSVASMHPSSSLSVRSQSYSSLSSLDDVSTYMTDHVISIEELRLQLNSCFTCGVSWTEDHVSLDCSECGGYSLERPCPLCDGHCCSTWKRDLSMSHACGKARWEGSCALNVSAKDEESRLCARMDKLTATTS